MARIGRRAKERRTREIIIGIFSLLFVFAVVGGAVYYSRARPEPISAETLCPAKGPLGHFVVLIDKTDPLNFTQKQAFSVTLKELIEKKLPEGYLLSVFALGEDFKDSATPLIELCNPGDGTGKSELTTTLARAKAKYQQRFAEPMLNLTESLVASKPAKWSPIFEMLQLVGINGFRKHAVQGERRLVLMSDMLHNTVQLTMYKGPVEFTTFSSSDYGKKAQAELSDVSVELHYLMNSPQLQTKRNLRFWEEYFGKAGARIVSVRPLEG